MHRIASMCTRTMRGWSFGCFGGHLCHRRLALGERVALNAFAVEHVGELITR
jgi:hypothetical protein